MFLQSLRDDRAPVAFSAIVLFLAKFLVITLIYAGSITQASAANARDGSSGPRFLFICTAFGLRTMPIGDAAGTDGAVDGDRAPGSERADLQCPVCAIAGSDDLALVGDVPSRIVAFDARSPAWFATPSRHAGRLFSRTFRARAPPIRL